MTTTTASNCRAYIIYVYIISTYYNTLHSTLRIRWLMYTRRNIILSRIITYYCVVYAPRIRSVVVVNDIALSAIHPISRSSSSSCSSHPSRSFTTVVVFYPVMVSDGIFFTPVWRFGVSQPPVMGFANRIGSISAARHLTHSAAFLQHDGGSGGCARKTASNNIQYIYIYIYRAIWHTFSIGIRPYFNSK